MPNYRELSGLQRTALVYALGTTTVAGVYWWYMRRIARHERRKGDHDHGHEQGAWAQRIPWSAERAKDGEGRASSAAPSAEESAEQREHDPLPRTDTATWGKTRMGGPWAERARPASPSSFLVASARHSRRTTISTTIRSSLVRSRVSPLQPSSASMSTSCSVLEFSAELKRPLRCASKELSYQGTSMR